MILKCQVLYFELLSRKFCDKPNFHDERISQKIFVLSLFMLKFKKTVALVTRSDLEEVCGVDQLCSGLRSGLEGDIHAVHELFNEHCNLGWGLLLVDATDAFNSVNRVAALWNTRVLWPRCSRFLFNTYCGYASLLVQDGNVMNTRLLGKEGVT